MQALLINLALFCQSDLVLPPAPQPTPILNTTPVAVPVAQGGATAQSPQDMRDWLLARLVVDLAFDAQKSNEVKTLIATMDDNQMRFLVEYYNERAAKRDQAVKPASTTSDQQSLEQAQLNLQQLEAYRDHLQRDFDLKVLNGFMNQNLLYQNMVNNQRLSYMTWPSTFLPGYGMSPYGYGGFGYGGIGYGQVAYAAYGYGVPGYGTSMMYANPYYGSGMGFY